MSLTVFRARWFSTAEWAWNEAELLANDTEEVRRWVNTQTEPQFRDLTRFPDSAQKDTLTITMVYEIDTLPYVLSRS